METPVTIASRFCGPPRSGNGGYTCGLTAAGLEGAVEATLRKPPPLERALCVAHGDANVLHERDVIVAEARSASLDIDVPDAPSIDRARAMSQRYTGFASHPFPTCFVCGPERACGDGLRIFAGGDADDGIVAAPWIPDASLADEDGRVRPEFLWAALDCPGYFAIAAPGETAVLGRMTADVEPAVSSGEPCVVVAWAVGRSGRKLHAGTALFDAGGHVRGRSAQTWILV